jgi:hypothetical protein
LRPHAAQTTNESHREASPISISSSSEPDRPGECSGISAGDGEELNDLLDQSLNEIGPDFVQGA